MYKTRLHFILIATVCMLFGEIYASHLKKLDVSHDNAEESNELFSDLETKLARFDAIEAKLAQFDAIEAALMKVQDINDAKETRLKEIEAKLAQYEFLLSVSLRQNHDLKGIDEKITHQKTLNADKEGMTNNRHTRALSYEGDPIAFTAYLDHDLNGIGTHENLVFGHVLLNDGDGYNMHTGIFTVPVSGVYHFDFFIGERDVNQMYVWLSVNNTNEIDAVAESAHAYQDIQGGNAANLKLAKGDAVFLKHYLHGTHIEGSDSTRISSFSGFLLYPTESVSIIGK